MSADIYVIGMRNGSFVTIEGKIKDHRAAILLAATQHFGVRLKEGQTLDEKRFQNTFRKAGGAYIYCNNHSFFPHGKSVTMRIHATPPQKKHLLHSIEFSV